ncbi:hypothetical protein B0H11DRAFT_2083423, partial [Mycena galericulata]
VRLAPPPHPTPARILVSAHRRQSLGRRLRHSVTAALWTRRDRRGVPASHRMCDGKERRRKGREGLACWRTRKRECSARRLTCGVLCLRRGVATLRPNPESRFLHIASESRFLVVAADIPTYGFAPTPFPRYLYIFILSIHLCVSSFSLLIAPQKGNYIEVIPKYLCTYLPNFAKVLYEIA